MSRSDSVLSRSACTFHVASALVLIAAAGTACHEDVVGGEIKAVVTMTNPEASLRPNAKLERRPDGVRAEWDVTLRDPQETYSAWLTQSLATGGYSIRLSTARSRFYSKTIAADAYRLRVDFPQEPGGSVHFLLIAEPF